MGSSEDTRKTLHEAMVAAMARDRGLELGLVMLGDDAVHYALEGGVRGAEGGEVPEHSVENVGAHGQDLVQSVVGRRPDEDCATISPGFEASSVGRTQGDYMLGEGLAFGGDGEGCRAGKVGNNGLPVAVGSVQGGAHRVQGELLRSVIAKWVHAADRGPWRTSAGLPVRMVGIELAVHAMAR
jgi:hypothetical protein